MAQSRGERYRYVSSKEPLVARLKKIEGQAKGIQRMIEEGRYCVDVLQQLTALTSAANEVAFFIGRGRARMR
ncbi:MAG: hypothetical protein HW414_1819 [Dehalococcoidia bacterium]|nr:hypothetical protein [Dehalococcoidia bacterium]